jgi:ABC-type antimicrobial peptide transport system permease subunit
LRQAFEPALAGIAVGIGGAAAMQEVLRTLVVGAGGLDVIAFACPAAALTLVAMSASLAPLLRAVRVDPIAALRME